MGFVNDVQLISLAVEVLNMEEIHTWIKNLSKPDLDQLRSVFYTVNTELMPFSVSRNEEMLKNMPFFKRRVRSNYKLTTLSKKVEVKKLKDVIKGS